MARHQKNRMDSCDWIGLVYNQIKEALHFCHKRNVYHLDVNPSNIIITNSIGNSQDGKHDSNGINLHVYLIDWGCSTIGNEEVSGFRGCPPFAHKSILLLQTTRDRWTPEPIHDIYALALSIASLIKKGTIPWDGFYQSQAMTASIDHRHECAKQIIIDSNLVQVTKNDLKNDMEESCTPQKRKSNNAEQMKQKLRKN